MPSNITHLQNLLPAAKANSSITESNSTSHGSPPVDSFFDTVSSSPEFSNITTPTNNNMSYLNQHLFQDFNSSTSAPPSLLVSLEKPSSHDPATAVIDSLAKGRALPQKGKLLQAVMDAGPLLQTVLLAGPLPHWRNPPPLQHIKVPPLTMKEYGTTTSNNTEVNSHLKPKLQSLHSSNATLPTTKCSGSVLGFAGHPSSTLNNAWELTSSSNVSIQLQSRKRQRHQ